MNDEGVAIALLKRHLSRVIGDAENRKYHMLACSNANVAKILELRYAEEALALFGYNREKQSRGFVFVADEKRLLQSLEQMRSFVSVLDCDQNSVILKLDRSLSLVNPEKASREHFLNSHLPASFYTFKTPSQAEHLVETSIENLREERKHVDPLLNNVQFPFSFIRVETSNSNRWQGVFYAEDDIEFVIRELSKVTSIAANRISLQYKCGGETLKRNISLKKIGAIPGAYLFANC
ncbi:hypothetical protein Tcan_07376 [Toxocara canis]|uniref:Uncharacterized protein n=1 Tax=Toxocara canis TaxID=6265 RepID=A0A0B2VIR3_TOXCA|nr:hypothetical protein Tcan_07376 [Toxocara canis]